MTMYKILLNTITLACLINLGSTNISSLNDTSDSETAPRRSKNSVIKFEDESNNKILFEDNLQTNHHLDHLFNKEKYTKTPVKFENSENHQDYFPQNFNKEPNLNAEINDSATNIHQNTYSIIFNNFHNDYKEESSLNINQQNGGNKRRRRRRRRKPRLQQIPGAGYGLLQPENYMGLPASIPQPGVGFQGPIRRPGPSNQDPLSSIIDALTSVARYDDFQCVPRLLCDVAGGSSSSGNQQLSGFLETINNFQPLIALFAAYGGVSTSPLFVFGRAALLGVTSKSRPGACNSAYPLCPTDPEKLVHYMNNHNGGFFRFFKNPQFQEYNQNNINGYYNNINSYPQGFGMVYLNLNGNELGNGMYEHMQYGLYQNQNDNQNGGFNKLYNQKYRLITPKANEFQRETNEEANNKIERRIQNKPNIFHVDIDTKNNVEQTKVSFPDFDLKNHGNYKTIIFQNAYIDNIMSYTPNIDTTNGFSFPGKQSGRQYPSFVKYTSSVNYPTDNKHIFDNKGNGIEEDGEIVYVVRGNNDPSMPEVIRLKPGQKVY